jgi:hypothetical protein
MLDYLALVKAYPSKHAVIVTYEVPLLQRFLCEGLRGEALFSAATAGNATVEDWHGLVQRGLPFVKVSALRSARNNWRNVLQAEGYDPKVAENTLSVTEEPKAAPNSPCASAPLKPDRAPELSANCLRSLELSPLRTSDPPALG